VFRIIVERERGDAGDSGRAPFGRLVESLEAAVAAACAAREEWPEQIAAGVYAGVDFAIDHPALADALAGTERSPDSPDAAYHRVIERLARLISRDAPVGSRLPGSTDEALVAGIVGLVGDHLRVGRPDDLRQLRPDLVLIALLPYLGFDEARRRTNQLAEEEFNI
jgi:hypothetical protein